MSRNFKILILMVGFLHTFAENAEISNKKAYNDTKNLTFTENSFLGMELKSEGKNLNKRQSIQGEGNLNFNQWEKQDKFSELQDINSGQRNNFNANESEFKVIEKKQDFNWNVERNRPLFNSNGGRPNDEGMTQSTQVFRITDSQAQAQANAQVQGNAQSWGNSQMWGNNQMFGYPQIQVNTEAQSQAAMNWGNRKNIFDDTQTQIQYNRNMQQSGNRFSNFRDMDYGRRGMETETEFRQTKQKDNFSPSANQVGSSMYSSYSVFPEMNYNRVKSDCHPCGKGLIINFNTECSRSLPNSNDYAPEPKSCYSVPYIGSTQVGSPYIDSTQVGSPYIGSTQIGSPYYYNI